MVATREVVKATRVSHLLMARLRELGISRSDFISKFQLEMDRKKQRPPAKNHLFKIFNGKAFAGENQLLPMICNSLGLDFNVVHEAWKKDKIDDKEWSSANVRSNKTIQEISAISETLSKRDQEEVLMFVKMKANR